MCAGGAVDGNVQSDQGSTCCSRDAARPGAAAGKRLVLAGGRPDQVEAARRQPRIWHRRVRRSSRATTGGEIPAYLDAATSCFPRSRAPHAAEDLPVPSLRPPDRATRCSRTRRCWMTRCRFDGPRPGGIRCRGGWRPIRSGARTRGRRRARTLPRQIQLRGVLARRAGVRPSSAISPHWRAAGVIEREVRGPRL